MRGVNQDSGLSIHQPKVWKTGRNWIAAVLLHSFRTTQEAQKSLRYSNENLTTEPLMLEMLYNLFVEKSVLPFLTLLTSNLRCCCSLSGDLMLDIMLDSSRP